ncbi:protease synthase and sporulation negative regulatory protein pai 1 [Lactobacillus plantarum subsp. plantarum ST-III] [Lactiplantibacillus mudanjiangensis]|uniref:GNAT family N-acetyltransferase n=1 Tax=Lactiplantibacillus mudanjiangensis TaxID=1296538 RepID=UPI00101442AA|nr:protease synthase and sporulation negative regulatory protein pai 1 [Lactobacillus plantarum subsp. plantarum ST-III] [Lactiplantibacillus mudanjiangensis]
MENTTLVPLTPADATALQQISIETYQATFAADNTEANMQAYLEDAYNLPKLTAELQNPDSRFYFVVRDREQLGYLKLNVGDAQSEAMGPAALEVERIYIRPAFKHQGLGSLFMQQAIDLATAAHKTVIWLGVWEHNEPAKAFYQHWGFEQFSSHDFLMGDDRQTDLLMKKSLA